MTYLESARNLYARAADAPEPALCCTTSPLWALPGLDVPAAMLEMNYGCGTTVHPRDLAGEPRVLYLGVGGGLELLQFAYFCRRPGAVIGVDPVETMRRACARNLAQAEPRNPWFRREFVDLRDGDALALPLEDGSADVVAQNCLFNIFRDEDLRRALAEARRVLRPHGTLVLSDPVAPEPLPEHLAEDEILRARCLSGAIPWDQYVERLAEAGFGTVEVRARRPYRVLDPARYGVERPLLLESVEVAAVNDPVPADGPCVFTGRTAVWFGTDETYDDGAGHVLTRDLPLAVCDKTAATLAALGRADLLVTESTWFHDGGGCC